jgi:hypothetical protein
LAEIIAKFWRELLLTFGVNYGQLLAGIIANFWREFRPTFGGKMLKALHVVSIPELSVLRFGGIIVHRSVLWITPISHIEKIMNKSIKNHIFYSASDYLPS